MIDRCEGFYCQITFRCHLIDDQGKEQLIVEALGETLSAVCHHKPQLHFKRTWLFHHRRLRDSETPNFGFRTPSFRTWTSRASCSMQPIDPDNHGTVVNQGASTGSRSGASEEADPCTVWPVT